MKKISLVLLFLLSIQSMHSQFKYSGRIETGYQKNILHICVKPSLEGGLSHHLENKESAIFLTSIHSVKIPKINLYTGAGLSYMNFQGIHGLATFVDLEIVNLNRKISPIVHSSFGYSHLWNHFPHGAGSFRGEASMGMNFKLKKNNSLYFRLGAMYTHYSYIIPLTIGLRY